MIASYPSTPKKTLADLPLESDCHTWRMESLEPRLLFSTASLLGDHVAPIGQFDPVAVVASPASNAPQARAGAPQAGDMPQAGQSVFDISVPLPGQTDDPVSAAPVRWLHLTARLADPTGGLAIVESWTVDSVTPPKGSSTVRPASAPPAGIVGPGPVAGAPIALAMPVALFNAIAAVDSALPPLTQALVAGGPFVYINVADLSGANVSLAPTIAPRPGAMSVLPLAPTNQPVTYNEEDFFDAFPVGTPADENSKDTVPYAAVAWVESLSPTSDKEALGNTTHLTSLAKATPGPIDNTTAGPTALSGAADLADDVHTVWFAWTAPVNGRVTVRTASSEFHPVLAVYNGNAASALPLVASGETSPLGLLAGALTFEATAGVTYHIAVDGYGAAIGSILLKLTQAEQTAPPANDNFATAASLTGENVLWAGANLNATPEPGEPAHSALPGGASIWFNWTAPTSRPVVIDARGSDLEAVVAVYTGTALTNLSRVAPDEHQGPNGTVSNLVTFTAIAGTVYHIAVDGNQGATGRILLKIA